MGRVIEKTYGQALGILKHFPYLAFSALIEESGVDPDTDGNKIVKAGTPFPSNDENCLGYLLYDVDVTNGDAVGAVVYQGDIDNAKLDANGITVDPDAKSATPRVTFFD